MGRHSLVIMIIILAIGLSVSTIRAQRPVWEPEAVIDMEWSPDGQYLALVTAGRQLRVLDETAQTLFRYTVNESDAVAPLTLTFATVDWNSTSSQLAVGIGRRILVFAAPQFQLLAELASPDIGDFVSAEFYQGPNYVHSMEFSPTNMEILASYADSRIVIWDLTNNAISFENTSGNLELGYQWSPNQSGVFYSSYSTFNLTSGIVSRRFGAEYAPDPDIEILPNVPLIPPRLTEQSTRGEFTAYATMVGVLMIADSIPGRLLSLFYMFPTEPGYENQRVPIRDMSWSSDDRYLAVITDNRVVWLVDLVKNERRPIIFYDFDLTAIDWKPNSNIVSIAYITPTGEAFIDNSLMPIFEDLYLEPITYTPTPTNTPTSTFTPTPTATPIPLPPADTSLLTNPSFSAGGVVALSSAR